MDLNVSKVIIYRKMSSIERPKSFLMQAKSSPSCDSRNVKADCVKSMTSNFNGQDSTWAALDRFLTAFTPTLFSSDKVLLIKC